MSSSAKIRDTCYENIVTVSCWTTEPLWCFGKLNSCIWTRADRFVCPMSQGLVWLCQNLLNYFVEQRRRSVQLLTHNRTHQQRVKKSSPITDNHRSHKPCGWLRAEDHGAFNQQFDSSSRWRVFFVFFKHQPAVQGQQNVRVWVSQLQPDKMPVQYWTAQLF